MGNNCSVNSICVDGIDSYTCVCDSGYIGVFCDVPTEDCMGRECINGEFRFEVGKGNFHTIRGRGVMTLNSKLSIIIGRVSGFTTLPSGN